MQDKKPDLSFFHVFGALCYPTNDNDDLGKLDAKADIGIFVGYVPTKKAFRIYNKRTHKIIETIYLTFDELTAMASEEFSSGLGLHSLTPATSSSGPVPNPVSQQPCIPPPRDDWDRLFQPIAQIGAIRGTPTLKTLPRSRMTKQGNFTQRTPQAKKQSDQASRQVSKQASGSANTPYDLVFPAMGPSLGITQTTATITSTEGLQRATFTTPPQTMPGTNTT
ncbi:retrovirus-related pol polyprotein from transposon TNT 1-94, partial [Tanacetum coccineum]